MEKKSKSLSVEPWSIIQTIVSKLQGQVLLAGIAIVIIFLLLIISGRLPLEVWSVTLTIFLALVTIIIGAHVFLEIRSNSPTLPRLEASFTSAPPLRNEEDDQRQLIEKLINRELLATRERLFKRAIHKFDDTYWTNLDIQFMQLEQNDDILEDLGRFFTRYYLKGDISSYVIVDPIEFRAQLYTMGVVKKIAAKMGLRMVSRLELKGSKVVVLAAVYSESLKRFLNELSSDIHLVIILLAPTSQHLANELTLAYDKVKTLVSIDSLEKVPDANRKTMITGVVK